MAYPMLSKESVRYTGAGGREHCSLCRHYAPGGGGRCARVLGTISPRGWCKLFSQEVRALIADVGLGAAGGGAPALSLDFMTPGTLNPAITFTRASTATYFNSAGVMQTATTNTPRWDYDPVTLALRGLLLEDQRTNIITNSIPLTGWTLSNATPTGASGIAPDATNTMVRLAETTANTQHSTLASFTVAASQTHNFTVYAKMAQTRYMALVIDDNGSVGVFATYDLQAGVVSGPIGVASTGVAGAASIQAVGNGIYRCSISGSIGAATTMRVGISLCNIPVAINRYPVFVGNAANGFLLWGAQLELGGFATSYIPTTAAAVTRSIDSCLIPPANMAPWFVAPGGSWFIEFISIGAPATTGRRLIARQAATPALGPVLYTVGTVMAQLDGVAQLNTANTIAVGAVSKGATNWAVGSARNCLNGGAVAASASLTAGYGTLATSGVFFFVNSLGAADSASGYIRNVRYWPSVLTDAQMQALTAP